MPCTPSGIIELLLRSEIAIEGQHAVVLGRSEIVGRPLAMMLLHRHATVTICHSRTPNLASIAATADLLVVAVGRPVFVTHDFVKPGATVIDVGINRITDPDLVSTLIAADSVRWKAFKQRGSMLVGDVHPDVQKVAGALTPVPGGVGPLTVAMLMVNTVEAATARLLSKTS
jgi:methylenetetrahydrofolate dehydrogenase (NADP+)/methenyltetrahydrofolate cyclohydrolase